MSNIRRLEFVKLPYLDEKSSDFDEIWYTTAAWELDNSHVTKYIFFKFKMANGRHFKNRFWP